MAESASPLDPAAADATLERLWRTAVGDDLAFLLARVNARSLAGANAALAVLGLKARSYSVLALAASGARPTQRELSEFLRLDPSQIVTLVDGLASQGLVQRQPSPTDRRVNVVVATEAGLAVAAQASECADAAERDTFGDLSASELEQVTAALRVLARF